MTRAPSLSGRLIKKKAEENLGEMREKRARKSEHKKKTKQKAVDKRSFSLALAKPKKKLLLDQKMLGPASAVAAAGE